MPCWKGPEETQDEEDWIGLGWVLEGVRVAVGVAQAQACSGREEAAAEFDERPAVFEGEVAEVPEVGEEEF